jgi:protease-4
MKIKLLLASIILIGLSAQASAFDLTPDSGKAAVIQLSGAVSPSSSGSLYSSGGITPGQVRDLNQKAAKGNYEAVIYEINSGGGTVVASKEVMREIDDVELPTVCRFRDVAASGAYLFALGCDRIVADSATITGSIGVKSSYLEFSGLLQKYDVDYVNISAGKYKEIGSPYQNATPEEKEILRENADRIHEQFLELVRDERNLTGGAYDEVETGKIFLGSQAEELGLVDRLGGRETARTVAENMTGKDLKLEEVQQTHSFNFLSMLSADSLVKNLLNFREVPLKASLY